MLVTIRTTVREGLVGIRRTLCQGPNPNNSDGMGSVRL